MPGPLCGDLLMLTVARETHTLPQACSFHPANQQDRLPCPLSPVLNGCAVPSYQCSRCRYLPHAITSPESLPTSLTVPTAHVLLFKQPVDNDASSYFLYTDPKCSLSVLLRWLQQRMDLSASLTFCPLQIPVRMASIPRTGMETKATAQTLVFVIVFEQFLWLLGPLPHHLPVLCGI